MSCSETFEMFLCDVCKCIREKSSHDDIKAELVAHLEDSTESILQEKYSYEEAEQEAVKRMGDPVVLGKILDESYKPKRNTEGWILIMTMLGAGVFMLMLALVNYSNVFARFSGDYLLSGSVIQWQKFALGVCSMPALAFCISKIKYTYILEHKRAAWITMFAMVGVCISGLLLIMANSIMSETMIYIVVVLFMMLTSITLITDKNKSKAFYISVGICFIVSNFATKYMRNFTSIIVLQLSFLTLMLFWLFLEKQKNKALKILLIITMLIAIMFAGISRSRIIKENLSEIISPQYGTVNYFHKSYNASILRSHWQRARPIGKMDLTDEYFQEIINERYNVRPEYIDTDNKQELYKAYEAEAAAIISDKNNYMPSVLMPKEYSLTYILAYTAFEIGYLPAFTIAAIFACCLLIFVIRALSLKNPLAKYMSLACALFLIFQFILFIPLNLGYALTEFGALPLLSDSVMLLLANSLALGVMLSCFKYDGMVKESYYLKR